MYPMYLCFFRPIWLIFFNDIDGTLLKITKVNARSPDGDTDYFDIVVGVLQGVTLAPYLLIIYLDYTCLERL